MVYENKSESKIPENFYTNISLNHTSFWLPVWIHNMRTETQEVICSEKPNLDVRFKDI